MSTSYEKQTTTDLMHQKFYSTCTLPKSSFITLLSKYIQDGGSELLRNFSKYFPINGILFYKTSIFFNAVMGNPNFSFFSKNVAQNIFLGDKF